MKHPLIDAVCPLVSADPNYIEWYRAGGVTALAPTVGGTESARTVLDELGKWHRILRLRDDVVLIRTAKDVTAVQASGQMGVYFHFQGTDPIEDNLDLIDAYKALGVGMIQLTYNVRNRVGDGCEERSDAGLSRFGEKLVDRLNQARVIVDCSHTGLRTSLDAVERSSSPVVLSHSNVLSLHNSRRNVADELVNAIAKSNGVIGVAGFPAMVADTKQPTIEQFVAHIDAIVCKVGIDYVGLGLDYYIGQAGVMDLAEAKKIYDDQVRMGLWGDAYPPPPHHYPQGIETPKHFAYLIEYLSSHGYRSDDVRKIIGGNWMRIMAEVWDD